MYHLGIPELNGELGLLKSPCEGIKWLKCSGEHITEFPHMLHELALLHKCGIDNVIFVDYEYAAKLLAQASEYAAKLLAQASEYAAKLLAQASEYATELLAQVSEYTTELQLAQVCEYTTELLVQASKLGNAPGAYRLGKCYEYGKMGCLQDPALSIHYYVRLWPSHAVSLP